MNPVAARLFLVFLLGVDWAADPAQLPVAVRALARRMASTECFCHSLATRGNALRRACPADPPPRLPVRPPRGSAPQLAPGIDVQAFADASPVAGLVYLFMSIRR
jgi:hypothetical protein